MDTEQIKRLIEKNNASLEAVMYVLQAVQKDYDAIKRVIEEIEDDRK